MRGIITRSARLADRLKVHAVARLKEELLGQPVYLLVLPPHEVAQHCDAVDVPAYALEDPLSAAQREVVAPEQVDLALQRVEEHLRSALHHAEVMRGGGRVLPPPREGQVGDVVRLAGVAVREHRHVVAELGEGAGEIVARALAAAQRLRMERGPVELEAGHCDDYVELLHGDDSLVACVGGWPLNPTLLPCTACAGPSARRRAPPGRTAAPPPGCSRERSPRLRARLAALCPRATSGSSRRTMVR